MSLSGIARVSVTAVLTGQQGLTNTFTEHPLFFSAPVSGCTKAWSDRRTIGATGSDDVNMAATGLSFVRLLAVTNLSTEHTMAIGAGWNGVEFRNFLIDSQAWNFAPLVNLGSATFRGYPVGPSGIFVTTSTTTAGLSTSVGGSILRIGGRSGHQYEIYALGT